MVFKILIANPDQKNYNTYEALIKPNINRLCQGTIERTYITREALVNADAVLIAANVIKTRHGRSRYNLSGFAIMNLTPRNLYVDVICAAGFGKKIMNAIEMYAKRTGRRTISLSALPQVINFYRQLGFSHLKRTKEPKEITRLAKEVEKIRFQKTKKLSVAEVAVRHKKFKVFLKALIRHRFTADKSCDNPGLGKKGCSREGYLMRKIIKP